MSAPITTPDPELKRIEAEIVKAELMVAGLYQAHQDRLNRLEQTRAQWDSAYAERLKELVDISLGQDPISLWQKSVTQEAIAKREAEALEAARRKAEAPAGRPLW